MEVVRAFETWMYAGALDSPLQAAWHAVLSVRLDENFLTSMLRLQPMNLVRDPEMVPMLHIWSLLLLHRMRRPWLWLHFQHLPLPPLELPLAAGCGLACSWLTSQSVLHADCGIFQSTPRVPVWLLAASCWLLAAGCWLRVGCRAELLLSTECCSHLSWMLPVVAVRL